MSGTIVHQENVLHRIVERRKETLAHTLQQTVIPENLPKSTRSLYEALRKQAFGFILECKKASPSKGLIREDFDIDAIVDSYAPHADALSILTEPEFFQGDFSYLQRAAARCQQPILCKDFVLSPEHVRLARFHGADAVLLMLSVLDDAHYRACAAEATRLGMDILTEVHDRDELDRAISLDAAIIGINNRNLKTLETTFTPTLNLAPHVPQDRVIITESGIYHHSDIMALATYADACLVGSSLMSQEKLSSAVAQLIYGDIKICGTTNQADTDLLNSLPVSYIGQVFIPSSKRAVALDSTPLQSAVPKIGVFDESQHSLKDIITAVEHHGLAGVQLHGEHTQHSNTHNTLAQLRAALANIRLIQTIHIHADTRAEDIMRIVNSQQADEYLLDTAIQSTLGGTGQRFNWQILHELDMQTIRVAGGINADNLPELKAYGVHRIDLASGSEASAGVKSPEKLRALFNSAKLNGKTSS